MAILNNSNAISSGGYDINNSLRFRSSASAYLNRTFGSTYTDKTKSTVSFWVKRGRLNVTNGQSIMWYNASGASGHITFAGAGAGGTLVNDCLNFSNRNATTGSGDYGFQTTQLFRDPSAWYHIIIVFDTGQATSTNRVKLYVNGTQVTAFVSTQYPSQNYQTTAFLGGNSAAHIIGYGATTGATEYFDGYLADFNFIDGQALTPSSFGETDTTTGVWKPKAYTGTYGTNGFYLKFSDIATTSGSNAGLGKDFSGNANYWTTNNISVTAGTTYDAMTDSPTLTSATVANYSVLNPLVAGGSSVISDGNLKFSGTTSAINSIEMPSGKWYWEVTPTTIGSVLEIGIANTSGSPLVLYQTNGQKYVEGVNSSYGATFTTSDIIGIALNADSKTIEFFKNNTSQGVISFTTNAPYTAYVGRGSTAVTNACAVNFGQRPFSYTPPTGFVRLNTYNLPDSTIKKGNTVMDATLYTGTGSSQSIVNVGGFKPDFVWMKTRNVSANSNLVDSVRGVTKLLQSNTTGAEATNTDALSSFNSNGFTVVSDYGSNFSGNTYVGWQWQAGQGSTSSNTSGSITSTVSVNATAGFSVVTYTGIGSSPKTVGHGLGVAPKMIILKSRGAAVNWYVWHTSLGATQVIEGLNTTAAAGAQTTFNNTLPTSSVISLGNNDSNNSGSTYVLYVWAEIAGFSKFTSYTGNGSADGPFVYCGFRPKFVMVKRTDTAGFSWCMKDSSRSPSNEVIADLFANSSDAEYTTAGQLNTDFLSNGFKLRQTNANQNANGGTYIVMAFAENPFKNSLAR